MLTSKCIAAEGFHLQAHVLLEHSFFQDFLQSLLIDTSSSLFSINTAILTQLLPHLVLVLPKRLPEVVPLTLLILQRALCWPAIRRAIIPNKPSQSPHQNPRDDPAWREIEGMDDEDAQNDPIMSPTDQRFGAAGDERIVVHAGPVEGKPAFATEGLIDSPKQLRSGGKDGSDEFGQEHG